MTVAVVDKDVTKSTNRRCFISTSKPNLLKKSDPKIGRDTLAITKFQTNFLRSPKSKHKQVVPYVLIEELFAAKSSIDDGLIRFELGGITEISAPESTRNDFEDKRS